MPSADVAHFLNVALDVQKIYYAGIRVSGGVMAATDNSMLVARTFDVSFLRGDGTIAPQAARVIAALAEVADLGSVEVDGNRVTVMAQGTKVALPEFYCRQPPVERLVKKLADEGLGWVNLVENPKLKTVKDAGAKDYVALVDAPHDGYELFRPKSDDDALWYSVSQLRRGLRLFSARARLSVRRSRVGWLAFEDGFGQTFAVTPFTCADTEDE